MGGAWIYRWSCVEALIHTIFVLTCMFRLNPWLTLVPLTVLPVIGFLAIHMERKLGNVYDAISEETAELNTVAAGMHLRCAHRKGIRTGRLRDRKIQPP